MDKAEAMSLLAGETSHYRARSYSDLVKLLDQTTHIDSEGPSGVKYQIDIEILWDGPESDNLRVVGTIDDGGCSAFLPSYQACSGDVSW